MLNRARIARLALALAALGLATVSPVHAQALNVRVNGVPFALRTIVLAGDPESLARRLDGRWGVRQTLPPGSARAVLGRQRGPWHETLTLTADPRPGFSRVVVAVHDLRRAAAAMPSPPLPLPAGARLVNAVQFLDRAGAGATYTIDMPGGARSALEQVQAAAAAGGWQRVPVPVQSGLPGSGFWAQRGARDLAVVALPVGARVRLVMLEADGPGAGLPR